ncbi:cytochrome P450 [Polaromonas sp. P1(28)-8]|nr:cytochrome P450 [Polaromonas sp. P1(28)-8]
MIIAQVSANRDERVFQDPDTFRLMRQPNPHLAFGAGIHVCLGRPLARMEAAEALPALARHFPNMQLAAEPVFNRNALSRHPVDARSPVLRTPWTPESLLLARARPRASWSLHCASSAMPEL